MSQLVATALRTAGNKAIVFTNTPYPADGQFMRQNGGRPQFVNIPQLDPPNASYFSSTTTLAASQITPWSYLEVYASSAGDTLTLPTAQEITTQYADSALGSYWYIAINNTTANAVGLVNNTGAVWPSIPFYQAPTTYSQYLVHKISDTSYEFIETFSTTSGGGGGGGVVESSTNPGYAANADNALLAVSAADATNAVTASLANNATRLATARLIYGSAFNGTGDLGGPVMVPYGGTGLTALTSGALVVGGGTGNPTFLPPGADGNIPTAAGGVWTSAAPAGGGAVTLLRRAQGGPVTGGAAADLDSLSISAGQLSSLDRLVIYVEMFNNGGSGGGDMYPWDGTVPYGVPSASSLAGGSGNQRWDVCMRPDNANCILTTAYGSTSGVTIFPASWTGAWTMALHQDASGGGQSTYWRWSVYKFSA
jgi:hypothetical protein